MFHAIICSGDNSYQFLWNAPSTKSIPNTLRTLAVERIIEIDGESSDELNFVNCSTVIRKVLMSSVQEHLEWKLTSFLSVKLSIYSLMRSKVFFFTIAENIQ